MMLACILIIILLCSSTVKGVPVNEEPLSSTEELLPYKDSQDSQERLKNEVLHEITTFLDKKKDGLASNCIAISPKLISYLKLYESGFFWYKSFNIQMFYMKGFMEISSTESAKIVKIIHFCHWNTPLSFMTVHPTSIIYNLRDSEDTVQCVITSQHMSGIDLLLIWTK